MAIIIINKPKRWEVVALRDVKNTEEALSVIKIELCKAYITSSEKEKATTLIAELDVLGVDTTILKEQVNKI